jgi:hypothetical protein
LRTREHVRGKRGSARPRQGHASHAEGRDAARRGPRPRRGRTPRVGAGDTAPGAAPGRAARAGGGAARVARAWGWGRAVAGREGRGARGGRREGACRGRRGARGREREREKGGELTLGSNSGDHRLQNLGHHGEREVEEGEGGCCAGNPNERGRRGGAHGGGCRAPGARGPGWAGLLRGSKPTTRTTLKRAPIANRKPRRNEMNTQHQTKKCASA